MRNNTMYRWFPLLLIPLLITVIVQIWPKQDSFDAAFLGWINIVLLSALTVGLCVYAIRNLTKKHVEHAGTFLRTKLVTAMVLMVLVPSMLLQLTANQMIEKGMDVWFDVRVDTLLDKAMHLAQGFYARIESDMASSLDQVAKEDDFSLDIANLPLGMMPLTQKLNDFIQRYDWNKVELLDGNERLILMVQRDLHSRNLSALQTRSLSDTGKMSMAVGRATIEHKIRDDGEYVVGHLPLYAHRRLVALLRAEVRLPDDVSSSARAIEADYRTYRELDRHRQGIQDVFTHTLMIVTLLIVGIAGFLALLFARRLTTPVEELAGALRKVEAGDFNALLPVGSHDELGSLVASFNSMTMRLQNNVTALQQTQKELTDALISSRQRRYVLEVLLLNLQSGVVLLNDAGEIRLMNQACRDLFALADLEIEKTSMLDFSEVHLAPVLEFYKTLQTQDLSELQAEFVLIHGLQTVKILARGTLLGDQTDTFSGWLLMFDDVTQLAEAQKNQAWSEVAQRLAHEIKNPLTPIKLSAERLQRRFRAQVDDVTVFDTCTQAVISQVERLQRLVADFSDLATLAKPKREQVSIGSLLQDLKELYSPYTHLTFEGLPEGNVCCDADQIRQVLINLIDNALATQALVRVFVEVDSEDMLFYVQDEGVGIDEQVQQHMFEPYFSTKKEGSGLGLAIAQRITEEHDGQLQLISASSPTRFCMRLPKMDDGLVSELVGQERV
ncbi:MAG: ATP-binding protein [Ghiorsea sp.]